MNTAASQPTPPTAPGPGSHTWRLLGDVRSLLLLGHTGLLQAMHPAIGSALIHQSVAFKDPWNRLLRSSDPILASVYGADAETVAHTVRDYHTGIRGTDGNGQPFHALNPAPFVWAHATFIHSQVVSAQFFGRPLTAVEKFELYAEALGWFRRYGMGLREVPKDWTEFSAYLNRVVDGDLTHVEAGAEAIRSLLVDSPSPLRWLPDRLWRPVGRRLGRLEVWVAAATLPPVIRDRMCLTWTTRDAALFAVFRRLIRLLAALLPHDARYLPQARAGWRRHHTTRQPATPTSVPAPTRPERTPILSARGHHGA
ncbi:oxygenase MpaB family protein [Streptomyces fulvoviolaceus]|uniref:oxygenase MpaB family protein n=1 Tax=Streptomyces fulvoviolaceus TaxID=285535 RepID=UPI0006949545|nr:oxygenase MpaB family protein [Streptomyces fulvoviolaceus]